MKRVEVIWLDAMIEEGHIPDSSVEAMLPIERHTLGYVITSGGDCIKMTYGTLENFYKGQQAYDMVLLIPGCMIKKIIELKEAP